MTRYSRCSSLFLILALSLLPVLSLAAEEAVSLEVEETTAEGLARLSVRVFAEGTELKGSFEGAEVYLNRVYVGRPPYYATSVKPGTYLVGVAAPGFKSREYVIALEEKRSYALIFRLEVLTGFLALHVEPADAEIYVDGRPVGQGLLEFPVGSHSLRLRRFAYRELSLTVEIIEGRTSRVDATLEPAPFTVSELEATKTRFNPRNAGPLGRTTIGFQVSSYGSARLELRTEGGELVFARDFPSFTTWRQKVIWRGMDEAGLPLPDGVYLARLEITPEGGEAEEALVRELSIGLDSGLIARPFGSVGGVAGLRYFPDPALPPPGLTALDLAWRSEDSGDSSFFDLALSYSFRPLLLSLAASGSAEARGMTDFGLDLGLILPLKSDSQRKLALAGRVAYREGAEALGDRALRFEAALPLALEADALCFGLAPGLSLELPFGEVSPVFAPLGEAGFWLSGPSYRLGLSGQARFGELLAAGSWTPEFSAALEGRYLLDPSPLVVEGAILAELPEGSEAAWGFSLGLGLFF